MRHARCSVSRCVGLHNSTLFPSQPPRLCGNGTTPWHAHEPNASTVYYAARAAGGAATFGNVPRIGGLLKLTDPPAFATFDVAGTGDAARAALLDAARPPAAPPRRANGAVAGSATTAPFVALSPCPFAVRGRQAGNPCEPGHFATGGWWGWDAQRCASATLSKPECWHLTPSLLRSACESAVGEMCSQLDSQVEPFACTTTTQVRPSLVAALSVATANVGLLGVFLFPLLTLLMSKMSGKYGTQVKEAHRRSLEPMLRANGAPEVVVDPKWMARLRAQPRPKWMERARGRASRRKEGHMASPGALNSLTTVVVGAGAKGAVAKRGSAAKKDEVDLDGGKLIEHHRGGPQMSHEISEV